MSYNNHNHSHGHAHKADVSLVRLLIIISLNFLITIAELIGGIISGSLSLLSDALHNFSDGIAIIVSYTAIRLSKRPKTLKNTFGLKRAEIIAALFNTSVLVIIVFFLIKEAVARMINPGEIQTGLMIVVASIGFTANLISVLLIKSHSKDNINLKSAYLHLLADAFSSVAVITGGIFMHFFHIYWLDPVITILICIYILKEGYQIIRKALSILMHSTPEGFDLNKIKALLEEIPGVSNIHHIHIWQLNEDDIFFEGHVDLCDDLKISQTKATRDKISSILTDVLGVTHITIQIELNTCKDKNLIKGVRLP